MGPYQAYRNATKELLTRADGLLTSMMPVPIVRRFVRKGKKSLNQRKQDVDNLSVLFIKVVGFNELCYTAE